MFLSASLIQTSNKALKYGMEVSCKSTFGFRIVPSRLANAHAHSRHIDIYRSGKLPGKPPMHIISEVRMAHAIFCLNHATEYLQFQLGHHVIKKIVSFLIPY